MSTSNRPPTPSSHYVKGGPARRSLPPYQERDGPAGRAFPAGAALFEAPQTTPHPAFGLPTYTHLPDDGPPWWRPPTPRDLPATVTGLEHVAQAEGRANGGGGIALFGSLAIVPDLTLTGDDESSPTAVLAIRDPSNPRPVVTLPTAARDVDTLAFPEGMSAVFTGDMSRRLDVLTLG